MRNLAPEITRQRLLIEGFFSTEVTRARVEAYLAGVAAHLDLRTYGRPAIFAPSGEGKDENQGYDAFLPLIDSGISLYIWTASRFLAVVLFTCKQFDTDTAVAFTREFFELTDFESQSF